MAGNWKATSGSASEPEENLVTLRPVRSHNKGLRHINGSFMRYGTVLVVTVSLFMNPAQGQTLDEQYRRAIILYFDNIEQANNGSAETSFEHIRLYSDAFGELQRLAKLGHVEAQFSLALIYATKRSRTLDYSKAEAWMRCAAENGHVEAQARLGLVLINGEGGTEKNFGEGRMWLERAVAHQQRDALCGLGYVYLNGLGVARDDELAFDLYRQAAELGSLEAIETLDAWRRLTTTTFWKMIFWIVAMLIAVAMLVRGFLNTRLSATLGKSQRTDAPQQQREPRLEATREISGHPPQMQVDFDAFPTCKLDGLQACLDHRQPFEDDQHLAISELKDYGRVMVFDVHSQIPKDQWGNGVKPPGLHARSKYKYTRLSLFERMAKNELSRLIIVHGQTGGQFWKEWTYQNYYDCEPQFIDGLRAITLLRRPERSIRSDSPSRANHNVRSD
ncbi:MAG: sel1 repeat family protein [Planctomycetales bacterium]|nr:sel1 repeat family protein [Planctomycetales bacterium]